MFENLYCMACGVFVPFTVQERYEEYPVLGEEMIGVTTQVCNCIYCGNELWHPEKDDENLKQAYAQYKIKHGYPIDMPMADIAMQKRKSKGCVV